MNNGTPTNVALQDLQEEELIKLLIRKDQKALELIYDRYSGNLNYIICRIVKSERLAEEVLRYSFLKISLRIGEYDANKEGFFSWMVKLIRKYVRSKIMFQRHVEMLMCNQTFLRPTLAPEYLDQPTALIQSPNFDSMRVLDLIYFEGRSIKELSEKYNMPISEIRVRLRDAIKNLAILK